MNAIDKIKCFTLYACVFNGVTNQCTPMTTPCFTYQQYWKYDPEIPFYPRHFVDAGRPDRVIRKTTETIVKARPGRSSVPLLLDRLFRVQVEETQTTRSVSGNRLQVVKAAP
jgi:hypothetical protein